MPLFKAIDQTGYTVNIPDYPERIISLVPSQSELLFHLGLEERVIGITRFCVHPEHWRRNKTRVGGTKKLHLDKIAALEPDLVLANKEENTKEEIEFLRTKFNVWTSDILTMDDNLEMITQVSKMVGESSKGQLLCDSISSKINQLKINPRGSALYVIWKNPIMAAGRDTYINTMLELSGYINIMPNSDSHLRYPELLEEDLIKMNPDNILLSSEP